MNYVFSISNFRLLNDKDCSICLSPLIAAEDENQDVIVSDDTRHPFHQTCFQKHVDEMIKKNVSRILCPVCQSSVDYSPERLLGERKISGIKIALTGLTIAGLSSIGADIAVLSGAFGKENFALVAGFIAVCFLIQTVVIVGLAKGVLTNFPS